jgi:hypothetical protein
MGDTLQLRADFFQAELKHEASSMARMWRYTASSLGQWGVAMEALYISAQAKCSVSGCCQESGDLGCVRVTG